MNTCPNCEYEIEFVVGTEGIGKFTICPRCACALTTVEEGILSKIKREAYEALPLDRRQVLEALQKEVTETPGYQQWFGSALHELVDNFIGTAMKKGLAREEVVPAILTLFHLSIDNMGTMEKIKWLVQLVDSMGDVRVEVMKMAKSAAPMEQSN